MKNVWDGVFLLIFCLIVWGFAIYGAWHWFTDPHY